MSILKLELDTDDMKECWNSKYEHIKDNNNPDYYNQEWLYLHPKGYYFLQDIVGEVILLSETEAKQWIKEQGD